MSLVYLGALAISLWGMVILDRRFRLFYWRDRRAAIVVTLVGVVVLLAADVAGIAFGIFFRGHAEVFTGVMLGPELPIEEVFFLWLLVLCTMDAYGGARLLLDARSAREEPA